jgi:hypothetical protein
VLSETFAHFLRRRLPLADLGALGSPRVFVGDIAGILAVHEAHVASPPAKLVAQPKMQQQVEHSRIDAVAALLNHAVEQAHHLERDVAAQVGPQDLCQRRGTCGAVFAPAAAREL